VKNVPGHKTDVKDAVAGSVAGVRTAEGQLRAHRRHAASPRPDPVPPKLVQDRGREVQRIHKVLEDASIKLDAVVSDVPASPGDRCWRR